MAGGGAVNATVLDTLIRALMVKTGYDQLLSEYGGKFTLSQSWIHLQVKALNLTLRKAIAAAQKKPDDWLDQLRLAALG